MPIEPVIRTFNPTKDTYLESNLQSAINGLDATFGFGCNGSGPNNFHALLHFDLSAIPAEAIILSAPFTGYIPGGLVGGAWLGWICRLKLVSEGGHADTWVESQASWDNYATGSPWTIEGGEYTTTDPAYIEYVTPTDGGWKTFADLRTLVQDAVTNRGRQLHILFRRADETPVVLEFHLVRSKDYSDPAFKPYLVVEYILPGWAVPVREAIFVQSGFGIDYVPGGSVLSGVVVVQNNLVGVATQPISSGMPGTLAVEGDFWFQKVVGLGINLGDKVYWDDVGDVVTKTSAGNIFVGRCTRAADPAATVVRVRLDQ